MHSYIDFRGSGRQATSLNDAHAAVGGSINAHDESLLPASCKMSDAEISSSLHLLGEAQEQDH